MKRASLVLWILGRLHKTTDILSCPHTQEPRKKKQYPSPPSSTRGSEIHTPPPVRWLLSSRLENENFRSLKRPDKWLRSTLRASENGCTALSTKTKQVKSNVPLLETFTIFSVLDLHYFNLHKRAWSWLMQATLAVDRVAMQFFYTTRAG